MENDFPELGQQVDAPKNRRNEQQVEVNKTEGSFYLHRLDLVHYEVNKKECVKKLVKVHHVFAVLMNKIAPYIKASMMMLVHKITDELRHMKPESFGGFEAGSNCFMEVMSACLKEDDEVAYRRHTDELKNELDSLFENNNSAVSCDEWHCSPKTKKNWAVVWCYLYYKHSYFKRLPKQDMEREGLEKYLAAFACRKNVLDFPEWVMRAIKKKSEYDFTQVKQLCMAYFQAANCQDELRPKTDAFSYLKFAKFCKAAEDAITRNAAAKLFDIRNFLCHATLRKWMTCDEKYDDVMNVMVECVKECRPFKNNSKVLEAALEEIERIKECDSISDICKVNASVAKMRKSGLNVNLGINTLDANEKPVCSFENSGNNVVPATANVENSFRVGDHSEVTQPLHEDAELENSYRRLFCGF